MAAFKGGSLVSNILQKASTLDDRVIEDSVQKLTKKSSQLKGEIYELVRKQYVEFDSYVASAVSFEQQLQEVTSEYKRLATRIDQELNSRISKSLDKRNEIEVKLTETQQRIGFVQNLVSIHHDLENSRTDLQSEKYVSAAERLCKVSVSLEEIGKGGCEAKVYQALKKEMAEGISDLSIKLQEEWRQFVFWSPKVIPDDPSLDTLLSFELRVPAKDETSIKHMEEVITAMQVLTVTELWKRKIVISFGEKLLKVVVKPLIVHGLKISVTEEKDVHKMSMVKSRTEDQPSRLYELFDSLISMFLFVQKIVPDKHQAEWKMGLGGIVCSEMAELIVAHSLSTSIPKTSAELHQYGDIEAKTMEFESRIVKMGLVGEGNFHRLSDYTKDVNTHFAAQISQDLLAKARSILMKPIHNAVLLPETNVVEKLAQLGPSSDSTLATLNESASFKSHGKEEDLSLLTFTFPSCVVSQSVIEFLDLLYTTLKDCSKSSTPSMAIHLFYTVRNMVDLFCAVLPAYHSSTISELPRVAAVQHNNCMYLSHHLITLGHQFHSRLPPPLNSEVTTFIDQVPLIRQLGEECYLTEMRKQCNCILDYLKPFGVLDNVCEDSRNQVVRQGIKQALLHLNTLSKVYIEVLPKEIHHKAMGALLNVLNSEMIKRVLALEDISVEEATELNSILNILLEKGPSCVTANSEEDVAVYSTSLPKLNELTVMLDASMQEIVDGWGGGNGTLAKHFTAVEVRGFIKAVFKNTERRANALTKITV